MHSFSVIVPVYNEETLLAGAIQEIENFFRARPNLEHEVIIVESGSTDRTGEVADRMASLQPRVRVIHEGRRNGFGSGVRLGYQAARNDWLWPVTPDLPFPLETLDQVLPTLERYEAVLSYRVKDPRGLARRLQSWVFGALVRSLFGLKTKSVNSAFKLLRRDRLQDLPLHSAGWLIDLEVVLHVVGRGWRYCEIPTELRERAQGRSKICLLTFVKILAELRDLRGLAIRRGAP